MCCYLVSEISLNPQTSSQLAEGWQARLPACLSAISSTAPAAAIAALNLLQVDAGGIKQSFIAEPIPVWIQRAWKLRKLPAINNGVSFTQITVNAD